MVSLPVHGLQSLTTISVITPPPGLTVYLRSQRPWCGVILSCARSGEVTFGVSVDDPLNSDEPRPIAAELLRSLCEATGGTRGWAVHEMPPSVDPRAERPPDHATNVADLVGVIQRARTADRGTDELGLSWSYRGRTMAIMSSVVKRSISLPADVFEALEAQAAEEGRTVSAALADAADLWLATRRGLRAVRAWEREHGALTAEELEAADRALDRVGVGRR